MELKCKSKAKSQPHLNGINNKKNKKWLRFGGFQMRFKKLNVLKMDEKIREKKEFEKKKRVRVIGIKLNKRGLIKPNTKRITE